MAVTLPDDKQFTATISVVDAKGNPALIDGIATWASSDPTLVAVTPSVDGLSALVVAVGALGTTQVTVTADADLGSGVRAITGLLDVTVVAGEAVGLTVTAGPLEPQP